MKKFIRLSSLTIVVLSLMLVGSCSVDQDENTTDGTISNTESLEGRISDPIASDYELTAFQITYLPGTTRPQRIESRAGFYDDDYTTLVSFTSCGSNSDLEIWYMEVHDENAPPACQFCSGPKSASSHIEDNGGDLTKVNHILSAIENVDCLGAPIN